MKRTLSQIFGPLLLVLFSLPVFAANTGDISGTVVDQNGALVTNAKVTVTSVSTGAVREVQTNEYGQFSVPQLEIGEYEVKVQAGGFKVYSQKATVRSGENTRVSANLAVGSVGETVTVEGIAPTLDVATAQVSESLNSATIVELPNQARDPVAYATLSPGTVPVSKDNPFLGTGSFNNNGSRGRANNITVDNIISSDLSTTGEAGLGTFSFDGVQEFKIINNNFDAEFGRNSGSQVQIITKSGGNQYHGTAYEFYQSNAFFARNFNFGGGPPAGVPRFTQNHGGFTFGGPLLPALKNHTFFFGHWELDKTRGSGSPQTAAVMTSAQATGITDPTSLALFKAEGSPSSASGSITSPAPDVENGHSWSLRIDQNFRGGKDLLFVRYGENPDTAATPGLTFVGTSLPGFGATFTGHARNVAIGDTMELTSNVINQFRAGFGRSNPNFVPNTPFPLGPQITILTVDNFGESNIIPQGRTQNVFQYGDTVSWVKGRHTFKFGGDILRYQSPSVFDANFRGTISFVDVPSFQAGTPFQWTQRLGNSHRHNFALDGFTFVQDDFRLKDTVTLNLGFRLESSGGVSEGNNLLSNIDPNNTTPIGVLGTGPLGGVDLGGTAFHRNWNPAPRLGAAWNPGRGKLVIRGGYGIAYDYIFLNPVTNLRFAAPFVPSITVQPAAGITPAQFANLVAGTDPAQVAGTAAIGTFPSSFVNFGSISAVSQNLDNPRNQQWNAGVEYQVTKALTLKTSYIGTKNDRLQVTMPLNLTQPGLRPPPATSLLDEEMRRTAFRNFVGAETGGATSGNNRIDPRFNTVTQVQSIGTSNYHSLQLEAIGKFGSWLNFNANYTYGHSIDDVSDVLNVLVNDTPNIVNPTRPLSAQRANSQFDLRQRFVLNYVYQIPFARNMSNGFVKRVLDGWSTSGIFSTQTGFPTTLFSGAIVVPDITDPTNAKKNKSVTDPLLLGTTTNWVNGDATQLHPAAFASSVTGLSGLSQPLVGNQGTSGRNHLRLAGLTDFDAAVTKAFKVTEGTNFQLRWEVFNLLNHPNLSGFRNTFTLSNFGQYTSTATNMRQMQVSARFQF